MDISFIPTAYFLSLSFLRLSLWKFACCPAVEFRGVPEGERFADPVGKSCYSYSRGA